MARDSKTKDGPKEGAKREQGAKRQEAFTERQRRAGLVKWQRWVTPAEADALAAFLDKMRGA